MSMQSKNMISTLLLFNITVHIYMNWIKEENEERVKEKKKCKIKE